MSASSISFSPASLIAVAAAAAATAALVSYQFHTFKPINKKTTTTFQRQRIFVAGATGFIGSEVAIALRRVGHDVYALVRDIHSPKAIHLVANEIICIQGDIKQPESYSCHLPSMHVVIHAAAAYDEYALIDNNMLSSVFEAASRASHRIKFIYTSGILVYPDAQHYQTEDQDTMHTGYVIADRVLNERRVIESNLVDGLVIRPAYVFGRGSHHFYPYFEQALSGAVHVVKPTKAWSQIHIDDLVDAYLRCVDADNITVRHHAFNVADSSRYTNLEIAKAFAAAVGYKGSVTSESVCPPDPRSQWSNKTVLASSAKLTRMLGWQPRKKLLLEDVEVIKQAWLAKQKLAVGV